LDQKIIILPIFGCVCLFFFSSCAKKIWNPYDESFGCPEGYYGDCSSVTQAYDKSIADSEKFSPLVTAGKGKEKISYPDHVSEGGTRKLNRGTHIPKVSNVKKYRVFIPGYIDDENNVYYGERMIYYLIDRPKWEW
jgi:hypothetical protein